MRTIRLAGAACLVSVTVVMFAQVPALADEWATASGSIGSARAFGESPPVRVNIPALAPCEIGAVSAATTASTPGVSARGFVSFGPGNARCASVSPGVVRVSLSGSRFRFDGLRAYGGPTIQVASWSATCTTNQTGSRSNIQLTNVVGIPLPTSIPANHTIMIPGRHPADPPLAKVVLNELLQPSPADGSMTVNLMHVWLFPQGVSLAWGEVVLGTVHCSPFG
jgi:hypothetical protein